MNITDELFETANRRAAEKKAAFPAMVSVRYDRRIARVVIALASGLELAFSPKDAKLGGRPKKQKGLVVA